MENKPVVIAALKNRSYYRPVLRFFFLVNLVAFVGHIKECQRREICCYVDCLEVLQLKLAEPTELLGIKFILFTFFFFGFVFIL